MRSTLITREQSPMNLEMPFTTLDGFIKPNEHFYVRNQFPIPPPDAKAWRLKIEDAFATPLEPCCDPLLEMEMETITATLECAGNDRAFRKLKPDATLW